MTSRDDSAYRTPPDSPIQCQQNKPTRSFGWKDRSSSMEATSPPAIVLNVASWNVNLCRPSHSAPSSWKKEKDLSRALVQLAGDSLGSNTSNKKHKKGVMTHEETQTLMKELFRNEILTLQPLPDIIALQEMPSPTWGEQLFEESDGYMLIGTPRRSHSGYVGILIRTDVMKHSEPTNITPSDNPSNAILLNLPLTNNQILSNLNVVVSSSHLAPFKGNKRERLYQMQELVNACISHLKLNNKDQSVILFVFVGDMNMRDEEDKDIETKTSFNPLLDAWKQDGRVEETQYTWDTYINRYWPNGNKYLSRYDRMYYYIHSTLSPGNTFDVQLSGFDLLGNEPLREHGGAHHFLSDHFGIRGQFCVFSSVSSSTTTMEHEDQEK